MTNAPDFGDVLAASLRDIWPALRSWGGWAIASVIAVTAVGVLVMPLLPFTGQQVSAHDAIVLGSGFVVVWLSLVLSSFFALASAVRTVKPEFLMTFGRFFGFFGYSILASLATMLGFILLVIPGLYVFVKVGFAPYLYLLRDDDQDPLGLAWALTRDRFWLTAALIAVSAVGSEVAIYASQIVAGLLFAITPGAVIVAIPLCAVAFFVAIQFQYNAYMRWAYALKTSSVLSNTATALPPTVTP